ncbi:MAG TPA: putative toxin-antitoxin system toxin component, PIN family [Candidatus Saccharimonadales bacterium]|jgi:hypothetical protein
MQVPPLKPVVVIDTNVWISGLVFGGNPEQIIRRFVDGRLIVVTAEELLSELRRKITQRFPIFVPSLALLEASIREEAILVQLGTLQVSVSRDVDDDKFIEAAAIGNAEYIIRGDKDLLDLKHYKKIKIVKPAEFLKLFS